MKKKRSFFRYWHPFILAIYPTFFLYGKNVHQVTGSSLIKPLIMSLGITLLISLCVNLMIKNQDKGALLTSLFVVLFFSYGHIYHLISYLPHLYLLFIFLVLLFSGTFLIIRSNKGLPNWNRVANLMAIILIATAILQIANAKISYTGNPLNLKLSPPVKGEKTWQNPRDIYYIILDGYAREDVLRDMYQFDNHHFISELENLGFYVAKKSLANYSQSLLSITSSLNMNYLERLAASIGKTSRNRLALKSKLLNNRLFAFLKTAGYSIISFANGYSLTELRGVDTFLSPPNTTTTNDFHQLILNTTPYIALPHLKALNQNGQSSIPSRHQYHANYIRYALKKAPLVASHTGAKFTFIHLLVPHPPFIFNANGTLNQQSLKYPFSFNDGDHIHRYIKDKTFDYRAGYLQQLDFINRKILLAIRKIIKNSARRPIIILQSDHGPGSQLRWQSMEDSNLKERMAILNCYLFPQRNHEVFYNTITPVNSFRLLLNQYFNQKLPLLPDRSFFSLWSRPFHFLPYIK